MTGKTWNDLPKIVILGTGGTIAGVGKPGKTTGYSAGGLDIETLIHGIPQVREIARLEGEQIVNVNSDDITQYDWLTLAERINTRAADDDVTGFVITHGTDTLEETAFFLNLTVKTEKPVVITGAMRPATAISPDGPFNLYQAVALASSREAVGKGVLAVFSDAVYSARDVQKGSTFHVDAFSSNDFGCLGYMRDTVPYFYNAPVKKHTCCTEFDVRGWTELPKVGIAYFHVDADPAVLSFMMEHCDGLVIAGAGNGEMSQAWEETLRELSANGKPVVITSRIHDGIVTLHRSVPPTVFSGDTLNPHKARIMLMLALTKTHDPKEMRRMFRTY